MNDKNLDVRNLEIIENQFEKTLLKMNNDPRIDKFKKEYQKLMILLKDSHQRERKIIHEYKSLTENINENTGKIKMIISISQQDSKDSEKMRLELMEAKSLYALQKTKEEASLKKIKAIDSTLKKLEEITKTNHFAKTDQIIGFEKKAERREELKKIKIEKVYV